MSSSYLLNLKINQLQQEIQGIGNAVGYFWNGTSPNGLVIDGGESACSIAAPIGNKTMYGYSDVKRGAPWITTAVVQPNSNMWFGISTDVTQTFPGASVPSVAMCNYGVVIDTFGSSTQMFSLVNGVLNTSISFGVTIGMTITMQYDGTNITFDAGNTPLPGFTQNVPVLVPVNLAFGSFDGGQLNTITWSGTGSSGGGGGTANLEDVLTNGNNAGNLSIVNVDTITLHSGGTVVDTVSIPPVLNIGSNLLNILMSKNYNSGSNYNLASFNLPSSVYNMFTLVFKTFNFSCDVTGTNSNNWEITFWLSDVPADNFDATNPLWVAYTTPNLGVAGGTQALNAPGTILAYQASKPISTLYLNFYTRSDEPIVFNYEPFNAQFHMTSDISKDATVTMTYTA